MAILALYSGKFGKFEVEIKSTFEMGGVKLATVRALSGQPFVAGNRYPIHTEWGCNIPVAELSKPHILGEEKPSPKPAAATVRPNLLSMALEYAGRAQWATSETVWLWRPNKQRGAFLSTGEGYVGLHLIGKPDYCVVFLLNPGSCKWETNNRLEVDYQKWVEKVSR